MDPELALYLGLLGGDVVSSIEQISRGSGREENPAVQRLYGTERPSAEQFAGTGLAVGGAAALVWDKLPTWAKAGLIAAEGGMTFRNTNHRNKNRWAPPDSIESTLIGALGAEGLRRLLKDEENVSAGPAAPLGAPGVGLNIRF